MRKSASQPQGLDLDVDVGGTPSAVPRARTLVPRASMSRIGVATNLTATGASRTSGLVTPRVSTQPSGGAVRRTEALGERYGNIAMATPGTTSKISANEGAAVSKIGVAATSRPSMTARGAAGAGFGFKPRTSAVYVGPTRGQSLLDGEDKEN